MTAPRTGLKQGVFVFALVTMVLPMVISGGIFLSYYKQETTTDINQSNLHLAEVIRDDVNNFLYAPRHTLGTIARLAVHPAYAPHIDDLMSQMANSFGFFESIMLLDNDGIVRHLVTASNIRSSRRNYVGTDLAEAEHIATALRLKQPTWSDTYLSPVTGEQTLSLTIPFERGMVVGNFNLSDLTMIIEHDLRLSLDRAYLVNSKGRIIAHPQKAKVLQQVNISDLPVVRAGLEGREGVYEYDVEGVAFIGAVVIVPETGWLVIVQRDRNEVFRSFRNMQRFFVVALLSALFFVAFFIGYVNTRIIKPVVAISATTKKVADGHFAPVPAYEGKFAELDDLTVNFNRMVAAREEREREMRQRNEDLEREVETRIRSEEALRRSEERFQTILDTVNDAIIIHDADTGAILDVNRKMTDMFGYPREEAYRMTMEALSSGEPLYTQRDAIAWIKRASSGKPQLFEWRYRHKDGRLFWGEVNMRLAAIGGLNCVLVVVRDISQRKIVEEKLHESERLYRTLFDSAGDAIFLMQGERIVDCNNSALKIFGCSWEHMLGAAPARFSPAVQPEGKESRALFLEKITTARAGEPQFFEWQYNKLDGTSFEAEVSLNRIELSSGMHVQSIVRDISERKKAEKEREKLITDIQIAFEEVSRSKKEWQDTFDSITDLISIHDRDFNIVKVNKAFSEHVGLPYQQVIGKKYYELLHGAAAAPAPDYPHARPQADGKPATEEHVDAVSGKTLRISTYPYYAPDGSLIGSIYIARDITEEKEREMRMIMTERLASLGQMASGIAHEINNPLESVMICSEMLLMRVTKDTYDRGVFEKYLKIIDEEVLRCRDITSNMLSFSRQTTLSKSDIDVHLQIDKAIDLVGYQGRLKHITVTKKYGEKILVSGNEGELRQVFLVLLINALDAMDNKGSITVETGTEAGSAWIRIRDTGPGIAPEVLQRIFHPFFSTKLEKGGTGLGLSIAHRIIANHRGSLTVVSEQGHGAAFTITLPR